MKLTKSLSVGIIGGTGKTGAQFVKIFKSLGFRVRTTGETTKAKNAELIQSCDVILFAVPLSRAADIIRTELASSLRTDQLLLDVSSLKTEEVQALLQGKGEVIGMHPLFGPSTDAKNETIILCPARATKETVSSLQKLFKRLKIKTILMTPEEHDKLMAVVQVIPHLKSLLMAEVLKSLDVNLQSILKTCTPTYELEFNVIGRFLDDHPDLYMPIIFRNPGTPQILRTLRDSIDQALKTAEAKDLPAAEKRYLECKKFFEPHLRRARNHSEACIRTLISLSK